MIAFSEKEDARLEAEAEAEEAALVEAVYNLARRPYLRILDRCARHFTNYSMPFQTSSLSKPICIWAFKKTSVSREVTDPSMAATSESINSARASSIERNATPTKSNGENPSPPQKKNHEKKSRSKILTESMHNVLEAKESSEPMVKLVASLTLDEEDNVKPKVQQKTPATRESERYHVSVKSSFTRDEMNEVAETIMEDVPSEPSTLAVEVTAQGWDSGEHYGWVQYWDTVEDAPYYYNVLSGESRWEPPASLMIHLTQSFENSMPMEDDSMDVSSQHGVLPGHTLRACS